MPTEKFCQKLSTSCSVHIIVQLGRITQQSRKHCYRRQGELFNSFPEKANLGDEITVLLLETQNEWPINPILRMNVNPLEFFKKQNLSKKSLWTFLGKLKENKKLLGF